MKLKTIFAAAVIALLAVGVGIIIYAEENDAATDILTVYYHPNASIYVNSYSDPVTSPEWSDQYSSGTQFTIIAVIDSGYTFDYWYGYSVEEAESWTYSSSSSKISISGQTVTLTDTKISGTEQYTLHLTGGSTTTYTITFVNNDPSYGNISTTTGSLVFSNIDYGTHWIISSNTFFVPGKGVCTAKPNSSGDGYTYSFVGFNYEGSGTVTSDMTVRAYFSRSIETYTVTIDYNSSYGTVTPSIITNVPYGSTVSGSGSVLTAGSQTATATPRSSTTIYNYYFTGWTIPSSTVTGNMTVTATFTQVAKDFPTVVYYHPNAVITVDGQSVTSPMWADQTQYGGTVQIVAVMDTDYTFDHWHVMNNTEGESWDVGSTGSGITISGQTVTFVDTVYGDTEYTLYLSGGPAVTYTVTFVASPEGYGSFSNNTFTAEHGSIWNLNNNKFIIDGSVATTAIPASDTLYYTYAFDSWSTTSTGSIVGDMTVTAYFTRSPIIHSEGTHWNNGMYNGVIDMVFQFGNDAKTHTMEMDLYAGTVGSDMITRWDSTGYSLTIEQSYVSSAAVTATLKHNGIVVPGMTATVTLGKWTTYQLTIDTKDSKIYAIPVNKFNSFIDYTLYESQKKAILDYSNTISNNTVFTIDHSDSSSGTVPVRFSVTSTDVFLETYGTVLFNPTINVYQYFPQYESVRLNFYSFALYGDSITINGHTYPVDDSQVTISYVDDGGNHHVPDNYPNATVKTRTFTLSNIYVTWSGDDGHCYLTFVNDRFTLDMGAYAAGSETVSYGGMWYFTTFLYEPTISTAKELGEWETLPTLDKSQMCLIFIGLLVVVGAVAYKAKIGTIFDTAIIGMAILIATILMGS